MGREIRRVPPNWEHPKDGRGEHRPMFDRTFEEASQEWLDGLAKWYSGEDEYRKDYPDTEWWEWDSEPPDRAHHRPDWPEGSATWFQVYQNVSEGTPVSPPFATAEELVDYLVEHGDYADQDRGDGGWTRESAEGFVADGWRPTAELSGQGFTMARDMEPETATKEGK